MTREHSTETVWKGGLVSACARWPFYQLLETGERIEGPPSTLFSIQEPVQPERNERKGGEGRKKIYEDKASARQICTMENPTFFLQIFNQ